MALILYLGESSAGSTSLHRANAIKRLGHTVVIKDPFSEFGSELHSLWPGTVHFRTGYIFLQRKIQKWAAEVAREVIKPDLIWVDMGELFGPASLNILKRMNCPIVLYNVDDPTGKRDGQRFASLVRAISLYDLVVVVRKETKSECKELGAKNVMLVYRSYDEVEHHPFQSIDEIPKEFRSEVAFIGTWMRNEKRDEFLMKLIDEGIPVSIWGNRLGKESVVFQAQTSFARSRLEWPRLCSCDTRFKDLSRPSFQRKSRSPHYKDSRDSICWRAILR